VATAQKTTAQAAERRSGVVGMSDANYVRSA